VLPASGNSLRYLGLDPKSELSVATVERTLVRNKGDTSNRDLFYRLAGDEVIEC
jgi:hypothetical protein